MSPTSCRPNIVAATEPHFHLDLSDADAQELKSIQDYVRFVNQGLS